MLMNNCYREVCNVAQLRELIRRLSASVTVRARPRGPEGDTGAR
jgi:hypothetical protein